MIKNQYEMPVYNLTNEQFLIVNLAEKMNMPGMAYELNEQFGSSQDWSTIPFETRMKHCLERELEHIQEHRFQNMYKRSRLPRKVYFSSLLFDEDVLAREELKKLQQLNFLKASHNVVLMGKTGVGKTSLAIATAVEAMKKGYPALYFRMSDLIARIDTRDIRSLRCIMTRIARARLLLLDDFGLETFSDTALINLNEIAEMKYGNGSIIITTQLSRSGLGTIHAPCAIVDAMTDRLFNDSGLYINIGGTSVRGKAHEQRGGEAS